MASLVGELKGRVSNILQGERKTLFYICI